MAVKIILGGPPRSGKSVLREALKQAIRAIPNAPYPYVITACPDGEGAWYQESVRNNPQLAAQLKADYKAKFTWAFAERIAESVRYCQEPLTFIDLGGIVDDKNQLIARYATHAILVAANPADFEIWRDFCSRLKLRLIAELRSDYVAKGDTIDDEQAEGIFRGSVHHLERGEDASNRPIVRALAERAVEIVAAAPQG